MYVCTYVTEREQTNLVYGFMSAILMLINYIYIKTSMSWATDCCGNRSTKHCSRTSEARWPIVGHKVIFLTARAACASISHGFSSFSQSMVRRSNRTSNREAVQQPQKCRYLSAAPDNLSFEVWKREETTTRGWGVKGSWWFFMSELKKRYASHCSSMFILPRNNQNPQ